jgi:hypothetical protein
LICGLENQEVNLHAKLAKLITYFDSNGQTQTLTSVGKK